MLAGGFATNRARESLTTRSIASPGRWTLLIGYYIARGSVSSVFGAAGSLVAILVWIYYSAQILFIGAEFTQVYANSHGGIRPAENAVARTEGDRANQGIGRKAPDGTRIPAKPAAGTQEQPWYPAVPVNRNLALFTEVLGTNESVSDGVERGLGRPAGSFRDYARRAAASGVWSVR